MRPLKDMKTLRLNFYMKEELVKSIDEYADSLGLTRSAAISVLCANQLQAINAMKNIGNVNDTMNFMVQSLNKG